MQMTTYLNDFCVRDFVVWMSYFISGKRRLEHEWKSPRLGRYAFTSVFDAYDQYSWPSHDPSGKVRQVSDSDDTLLSLRECKGNMDRAIEQGDAGRFRHECVQILRWGGIQEPRLIPNMDSLVKQSGILDPFTADDDRLGDMSDMSSGYSKIYSVMLDDFPIYDSRVACALTSFVFLYASERSYSMIPNVLGLRIPPTRSRQGNRNPFGFPTLHYGEASRYAESNLHAAWLIWALAQVRGEFDAVPLDDRMFAIQSSMFMLGYSPLDESVRIHRGGMSPIYRVC